MITGGETLKCSEEQIKPTYYSVYHKSHTGYSRTETGPPWSETSN